MESRRQTIRISGTPQHIGQLVEDLHRPPTPNAAVAAIDNVPHRITINAERVEIEIWDDVIIEHQRRFRETYPNLVIELV